MLLYSLVCPSVVYVIFPVWECSPANQGVIDRLVDQMISARYPHLVLDSQAVLLRNARDPELICDHTSHNWLVTLRGTARAQFLKLAQLANSARGRILLSEQSDI